MITLLLLNTLLILSFSIQASTPDIVVSLSKSGLNKIKEIEINRINQDLKEYAFQNYSYSNNALKYTLFNSTYQQALIQSFQVELTLLDNLNVVQINMNNLSGIAKINIEYENDLIKAISTGNVTYQGTTADIEIKILKDLNGRPTIQATGNINPNLDQININFDENNYLDYLQPLKPSISSYFISKLSKYVDQTIQNEVEAINKNLSQLSQNYQIYKSVYEYFSLYEDPSIQNDHINAKIDSYSYYENQSFINKDIISSNLPLLDPNNTNDAQFFLSDSFFQNILDTSYEAGLLSKNYIIYYLGRTFNLSCFATRSPNFTIMDQLNLNGSGQCNITHTSPLKTFYFPIAFDFYYELNMTIDNSTIHFRVNEATSGLSNIRLILSVPIELVWFNNTFNSLFAVFTTTLNNFLGANGIPLSRLLEMPFSNINLSFRKDYISIYFDIILAQ